jgi:tetratricopeptide (TPR) repeat protein
MLPGGIGVVIIVAPFIDRLRPRGKNQGVAVKNLLLASVIILLLVPSSGCMSKEDKRDALMENARKLEETGDCVRAAAEARGALEIDPGYAGGYLLLGRCELKAKKPAEALRHFARAHELDPADFEAVNSAGRLALQQGDLQKAEEYVTRALALKPDSVAAGTVKGSLLLRKNDVPQAMQILEAAVKADPTDEDAVVALATAYLNSDKAEHAKSLLRFSLEKKPDSSAMLVLLLDLAFREEQYAEAEGYLNKLLALHPDDEHLAVQMADCFSLLGKGEEGPAYLAAFLETHPGADAARVRLTELLLAAGDNGKALATLDAAPVSTPRLRLAKGAILMRGGRTEEGAAVLLALGRDAGAGDDASAALMTLANAYLLQGREDEAVTILTERIARGGNILEALALRGRACFLLQRYAEAVQDFTVVAGQTPNDPSVALALADAQNAAGKGEEAEKTIREAIARSPKFAPAYVALANFFMMRTDPFSALEAIREGKKALADNLELALAEADILIREQRYTEAEDLLTPLIRKEASRAPATLRLAAVHAARKEYDKAIKAYDRLLEMDSGAMPAVEGRIRMHLAAGEPDKALAFAEKRRQSRPTDPMAAFMVGELALVNRDVAKAEKAFFQSLELAPHWEQPAARLAQIFTAGKRLDEGMAAVRALVAKKPEAIAPRVLLANLQEEKQDWIGAEQSYRDMLVRQPDNLLAANNLAYIISRFNPTAERLKEAETHASRAAATRNPSTLDTLGWIQHLLGKKEEAERTLRKAREENRENPVLAYHLAVVLSAQAGQANQEEAKDLLREIVSGKTPFPQRAEAEKLLREL